MNLQRGLLQFETRLSIVSGVHSELHAMGAEPTTKKAEKTAVDQTKKQWEPCLTVTMQFCRGQTGLVNPNSEFCFWEKKFVGGPTSSDQRPQYVLRRSASLNLLYSVQRLLTLRLRFDELSFVGSCKVHRTKRLISYKMMHVDDTKLGNVNHLQWWLPLLPWGTKDTQTSVSCTDFEVKKICLLSSFFCVEELKSIPNSRTQATARAHDSQMSLLFGIYALHNTPTNGVKHNITEFYFLQLLDTQKVFPEKKWKICAKNCILSKSDWQKQNDYFRHASNVWKKFPVMFWTRTKRSFQNVQNGHVGSNLANETNFSVQCVYSRWWNERGKACSSSV